jgi:hypothetical protein
VAGRVFILIEEACLIMKKINSCFYYFVFWPVCLFAGLYVRAEEIKYEGNWGVHGFSIERQGPGGVKINFSVTRFFIGDQVIDGENLQVVRLPGVFLPNNEGCPDLPTWSRYIAVPQGAVASVKTLACRGITYRNLDIAPAFRIPLDTDQGPLVYEKNMSIYSMDAFYPAEPVLLSKPGKIRGMDVVMLSITPFQYNPVRKELIVTEDVQVEVTFSGGKGHFGEDRLRSRWFDPILSDVLLNRASLPEIDYDKVIPGCKTPDYEYLIICPDEVHFISWANVIRDFRLEQGINTGVRTTTETGGNTVEAIENYLYKAYTGWEIPPVAILLLGDYGTSGNTIVSPIYNSYCVSDNMYADVDNDHLPDMIIARMTAQNSTHLQTMVTKFINYETSPPSDTAFYDHPITALGWQTDRWFQICSETVGGFWKNVLKKFPVRINAICSGTPGTLWSTAANTSIVVDYFGPNGLGYIPESPATLGGWTGGTASMVNNAINTGSFMLLHRDHGGPEGWGEPAYNLSSIDGLTNNHGNKLPWIFSINCMTGMFDYGSEVFAEKFHRYRYQGLNAGALGVTAASQASYSFVNDAYVWGMMDYLWPDFMPASGSNQESRGVLPAFGSAAGKYFLSASSWPNNPGSKEVTYHLFHSHGDAFCTVYSEMPQPLTVVHDTSLYAGATSFAVVADEGAFIALTANGSLLATATGTGLPVDISIPAQAAGTIIKVVITKQNFFRYAAPVSVLSSSFPVDLKVMLEGPFDVLQMSTCLNTMGHLPLIQPYSTSPWFYQGTEALAVIPNTDVVDWVLVEFRETGGGASTATPATMIEREAALLLKDGSVVGLDGASPIFMNSLVTQNLYVVIWHRNHLAVMSAIPLILNGGSYTYDFTSSAEQAYGGANAHKCLVTGVWGMVAGDGNADGNIGMPDKVDTWIVQGGNAGYLEGDFDLNGSVDNADKVEKWSPNSGRGSQVP